MLRPYTLRTRKQTMITVNPRNRRSVRWKRYDYTSSGFYYVTLCAEGRECIFGEVRDGAVVLSEAGHLVRSCWEQIPAHFPRVELDAWILMPNHLLCAAQHKTCYGECLVMWS